MVQQVINTGTFPNDATGDPAQTAFIKINNNFGQLFGTSAGVTFGPPPFPPGGVAVTINAAAGSPALVVTGGIVLDGFTVMQTGTFTATATGIASGTTTGTAVWRILFGKVCVLNIPIFTGPSNSTSFTVTGLPATIQPATLSTHFAVGAADNSVEVGSATVTVNAGSGTLIYGLNGSTTGWTATGGKSGGFCTLVYLLD